MSDQISPVSESPIDQARMSIIAASIGSCSCNTKSPNVAFHEGHCRYVKLMFALDCLDGLAPSSQEQLVEAGAAIVIRNELDRVRADRDYQQALAERWKAQFDSAAAAASEYSEFWEKHCRDFDQFGNYVPYSQMDGDLRAAKRRIAELEAALSNTSTDRPDPCPQMAHGEHWCVWPKCNCQPDSSPERGGK